MSRVNFRPLVVSFLVGLATCLLLAVSDTSAHAANTVKSTLDNQQIKPLSVSDQGGRSFNSIGSQTLPNLLAVVNDPPDSLPGDDPQQNRPNSDAPARSIFKKDETDADCDWDNLEKAARCAVGDTGSGPNKTIPELIKAGVDVLAMIIGVVSVIVIMVQGLRMIVSGGDAKSFNEARNGILYAIIGIVVAVFAPTIVRFVLNIIGVS